MNLPEVLQLGWAGDARTAPSLSKEHVYTTAGRKVADCCCGSREDATAFAAELVRRWNAHAAMLAACKALTQAVKDACEHWDADRDAKVGKLLAAMAGHLPGYRADLDAAHATLTAAEGKP